VYVCCDREVAKRVHRPWRTSVLKNPPPDFLRQMLAAGGAGAGAGAGGGGGVDGSLVLLEEDVDGA
jgi:hypothetical protein